MNAERILQLALRHLRPALDVPALGLRIELSPCMAIGCAGATTRGLRAAGSRFLASLPPMERELSRLPKAPTWDFPSRSCCAVFPSASFFSVRCRLR